MDAALDHVTGVGERDPANGRIANRSSAGEYGALLDLIVEGGDPSSDPAASEHSVSARQRAVRSAGD